MAARRGDPISIALLAAPEYSDAVSYLWEWFNELNGARSGNGFGMNLLSYSEIDAWARLTRRSLSAWEVSALKSLDVLLVSTQAKK